MSAYQKLHPAIRHHIKDSLGWSALQPEQLAAIAPILANQDCLLLPFAAGAELEGAMFPVLSRMISESWGGISALYVCPMKAQLAYVEPRLAAYLATVGRRAAVWHGELSAAARREVVRNPPDLLLTTPESLDQMLMGEPLAPLGTVRTVIVDELAAFAGDDRGWHLRAALTRLGALGRRPPQLIALSASLANPEELMRWLSGNAAAVCIGQAAGPAEADVEIEHAGSLSEAARCIAHTHAGQKRLVFCDSDAQVEELVRALRKLGTRVFASHGSLSAALRRAAEISFVQEHDCVIVAAGSLELGAELGDVDRVIQIDAPATVSSFLRRMARSGRRPGSRHNCLFLTLRPEALLVACALTRLWRQGHVEEVQPPPAPWRVVLQQLWALLLEHGPRPADELLARLVKGFPGLARAQLQELLQHLQSTDILRAEEDRLAPGREGERRFGQRHFRALTSVFLGSSPDFLVRHGRREIGYVTPSVLLPEESGPAMVSLAGQSWRVQSVDWQRRRAAVVPPESAAPVRWGTRGRIPGYALAQAVRQVLAAGTSGARLWPRAQALLQSEQQRHAFLGEPGASVITEEADATWLWTFAGLRANQTLARALAQQGLKSRSSGALRIGLPPGCAEELAAGLPELAAALPAAAGSLPAEWLGDEHLKLVEALPPLLQQEVVSARLLDLPSAARICAAPVRLAAAPVQA